MKCDVKENLSYFHDLERAHRRRGIVFMDFDCCSGDRGSIPTHGVSLGKWINGSTHAFYCYLSDEISVPPRSFFRHLGDQILISCKICTKTFIEKHFFLTNFLYIRHKLVRFNFTEKFRFKQNFHRFQIMSHFCLAWHYFSKLS